MKYLPVILIFFLLAPIALPEESTQKDFGRELSHSALFAPNTNYPYFEHTLSLDTDAEAYLSNAAFLAQCSMLIYVTDKEFVENALRKAGYSNIEYFDEKGAFAFLAEDSKNRILIFRGTEQTDKNDIRANLKVSLVKLDQRGRVHRGFKIALGHIEEQINKSLANRENSEPKTLWVAGHSQGGALATLWAIKNQNNAEGIYSIGAPRISDKKLTESLNETLPLFRFVNDNDYVPKIPVSLFYRHIGKTYFISSSGNLEIDPSHLSKFGMSVSGLNKYHAEVFQDRWMKGHFSAIPIDYYADHSPLLYVEALLQLCLSEKTTN
ncbi:lipase family protein [Puniceicoccaceae bacterium K14]|nr:lipase family protein [Puniceicoccaceae bacterium K14]